ncbi:hypothetical protein [Terrabacter sp. 2RAF25]|uniref:hypothetical protein n=1 Tax=Terrabacter sp. 2RAF25 TaxID=3232998 RepID=UPI003F974E19
MRKIIATSGAAAIAAALLSLPGAANAAPSDTRQITSSGTTSIRSLAAGADGLQQPELRAGPDDEGPAAPSTRPDPNFKHGIFPKHPLEAPVVASSAVAATNPAVRASIQGLNHRDQRLANGGNQFSTEPPDQALCVGNGFTVESVNSVLRVYNANAVPVTGVQDLNTFFGYPAAFNRATGNQGPDVIDPVCHFDPDFGRFVVAITTLHVVPATGDFTGRNTIDVAVSNTGDPTGSWTVYSVPAQNDGTEGTPNHGCTTDGTTPGPCFQDYPHIGGDANGIYITTNEYDLFGPNFNAAQVFAFSKAQLAAHPTSVRVTLVPNLHLAGTPGFTVWPATSPANQYATDANGTEFMLSSVAGDGSETGNPTGTARRIGLWALTNTASLGAATPDLRVTNRVINSETYVVPPKAEQKPGPFPLGQCINDTTLATPFGPGCWQFFFNPPEPAHDEVISHLDANDSRMQQTWYTNGVLWGALDTAVRVNGQLKAGVAWFAVEPKINGAGKVGGKVEKQGYLGLANSNLTYPAITMLPNGKGAIAFTVGGADRYPSAGYAAISSAGAVGPIHIVGAGLGPADGFTSYKAFVGSPIRTRWGDYGAAVTDGRSIWMASEYIAQTCTLAQYVATPFGSCGGTRTSLGNWSTRITKITP